MSAAALAYAAFGTAIACEVAGTTLLQKSEQFTKVAPKLGMVACYGAAFFLMSLALEAMPPGVVYAIWSGVGINLTALIGALVFEQAAALSGHGRSTGF